MPKLLNHRHRDRLWKDRYGYLWMWEPGIGWGLMVYTPEDGFSFSEQQPEISYGPYKKLWQDPETFVADR